RSSGMLAPRNGKAGDDGDTNQSADGRPGKTDVPRQDDGRENHRQPRQQIAAIEMDAGQVPDQPGDEEHQLPDLPAVDLSGGGQQDDGDAGEENAAPVQALLDPILLTVLAEHEHSASAQH